MGMSQMIKISTHVTMAKTLYELNVMLLWGNIYDGNNVVYCTSSF